MFADAALMVGVINNADTSELAVQRSRTPTYEGQTLYKALRATRYGHSPCQAAEPAARLRAEAAPPRNPDLQSQSMSLWERTELVRTREREQLRLETAAALKTAMSELLPGLRYVVFGSLIQSHRFHKRSDVDVALFAEVPGWSEYRLLATLEARLGRPVDVVLLPECRFREKILREGEIWTNSD